MFICAETASEIFWRMIRNLTSPVAHGGGVNPTLKAFKRLWMKELASSRGDIIMKT